MLILRRHRYGESSLVVHFLTRSGGRVSSIAKGAYRPKSAYYGVLDVFDTLEASWTGGTRGGLASLREARPVVLRRAISRDLGRFRSALAVLELADLAARPGQEDGELFRAVERALDRLAGSADPGVVHVAFELHFLAALGLFPSLSACAACGEEPETGRGGRATFSAGAGGRLCERCAAEARSSGRRVGTLPLEVLRIASALAGADDDLLASYRISGAHLSRVRDFVDRFLEYHLEARPRSWRRRRAGRPTAGTRR